VVEKVFDDVAPRYADRAGGYAHRQTRPQARRCCPDGSNRVGLGEHPRSRTLVPIRISSMRRRESRSIHLDALPSGSNTRAPTTMVFNCSLTNQQSRVYWRNHWPGSRASGFECVAPAELILERTRSAR
jgi:hypothetical protein